MHSFTNRLAKEKSPYLLQHANNPVDWHPWGDEAFEWAKRENKPIFLSIGYSTCHWCHVMEHESFESEEIARLLNEVFVCIKVDREERPDIDSIYMTVCQMMTGSGGWPLSIFMTPDKKPFHAATYIPPDAKFGRMGLKQLVPRISDAWKTQRDKVLTSSEQIAKVLSEHNATTSGSELDRHLLDQGYAELMKQYDAKFGGFGSQPKFPTPHRLVFLLRQGRKEGIKAVEHTLEEMRKGGIFDQVGYGFHRYSTDRHWLVPHFEKMLYDQALLAYAYAEAFELTGKKLYADVAEEILTYVLRDMTSPEGGFYSAEDADSEGEEGLFYVWDSAEMANLLGDESGWLEQVWNIEDGGNYHDEASGMSTGKNIPHLAARLSAEDRDRLEPVRTRLFEVRETRVHPLKDTKILADWNGLMIAAFAKAGRALGKDEYVQASIRTNAFIEKHMRREDGRLWHRYCDGEKLVEGHLEDYAFMIHGLLELYESTLDAAYLERALEYNTVLEAFFKDERGGGYFMTAADAEALIVRPKDLYDGAIPSGNSIQMLNLLRLARLTGRAELEQQASETGKAYGEALARGASNFAQALIALQYAEGDSVEIVVVGSPQGEDTRNMLDCINRVYNPGKVVLLKDPIHPDSVERLSPFTKGQTMVNGKATVYICRNFSCQQPVNSIAMLKEKLRGL